MYYYNYYYYYYQAIEFNQGKIISSVTNTKSGKRIFTVLYLKNYDLNILRRCRLFQSSEYEQKKI